MRYSFGSISWYRSRSLLLSVLSQSIVFFSTHWHQRSSVPSCLLAFSSIKAMRRWSSHYFPCNVLPYPLTTHERAFWFVILCASR
jgi:hypothetical protein